MLIDNSPMAKFKRELRQAIGSGIEYIEEIKNNVLVIPDQLSAETIERSVSRLTSVEYAFYHHKKGGIVFALK